MRRWWEARRWSVVRGRPAPETTTDLSVPRSVCPLLRGMGGGLGLVQGRPLGPGPEVGGGAEGSVDTLASGKGKARSRGAPGLLVQRWQRAVS